VFEEALDITFDDDIAFLNFMKRTGVYLDDLCLEAGTAYRYISAQTRLIKVSQKSH